MSGGRGRRGGSRRRRPGRLQLAVVAAASVAFVGSGLWQAYDTYRLATRGVVVHATMIEEHTSGREHWIEVEFTTRAGEDVRAETSNFTDDDRANLLDVVYDPDDPSRMQAADRGFDYWLPAVCLGLGSALAGLTVHASRHGVPGRLTH